MKESNSRTKIGYLELRKNNVQDKKHYAHKIKGLFHKLKNLPYLLRVNENFVKFPTLGEGSNNLWSCSSFDIYLQSKVSVNSLQH